MFHGVINSKSRQVLSSLQHKFPASVSVLCSGNFTIETLLRMNGYEGAVSGCDVSLYSCAIGAALSTEPIDLSICLNPETKYPDLAEQLRPLMDGGAITGAVAVALALDVLQFYGNSSNPFFVRMRKAYFDRFPDLFGKAVEKLKTHRNNVAPYVFYPLDAWERIAQLGPDEMIFTAPPILSGDYESQYKKISNLFMWRGVQYGELLNDQGFLEKVHNRGGPYVMAMYGCTPESVEIAGPPIARIDEGRTKQVFYFSNLDEQHPRLVRRKLDIEPPPYPIFGDADQITPSSKVEIIPISGKQDLYIRTMFIAKDIACGSADRSYLIMVDGKYIGLLAFQLYRKTKSAESKEAYSIADTTIPHARYAKLAKLILYISLSKEIYERLRRDTLDEYEMLFTVAYSKHPVSMKYRGVYDLHKRTKVDGKHYNFELLYKGKMAQWTVKEGLQLWLTRHTK